MALATGTRFGAYEILTLIGSGGLGEMYSADGHQFLFNVRVGRP